LIVGLYIDPPAHAVVLSVDEKSQIQALDRTQPGLPLKRGRCGTMTHDYKRHGTTTLFAAFDVLEGSVFGRCMQRHRGVDQDGRDVSQQPHAAALPAGTDEASDRRLRRSANQIIRDRVFKLSISFAERFDGMVLDEASASACARRSSAQKSLRRQIKRAADTEAQPRSEIRRLRTDHAQVISRDRLNLDLA
jgi:hypothetical protein